MRLTSVLIFHSPAGREVPSTVERFAADRGLKIVALRDPAEVIALVDRSFPACIIMAEADERGLELCRLLKSDTFRAIVPVIFLLSREGDGQVLRVLDAGADEILIGGMAERERLLRLRMALERADRDVSVHPSTRLPGTAQIERDIAERLRDGEPFAVCYADLDHFKEFNDCYGYNQGDRIIYVLSRILRDVVKGHAPTGFIGHIGGDDFIFNVPLERMQVCCEEILEIFDQLIPFQYTEEDRRAGYITSKDRRGQTRHIPIMTLSIGVVTNRFRRFTHTAHVSEVASEMKSYAKTLPGSVYAVDRRTGDEPVALAEQYALASDAEQDAERP